MSRAERTRRKLQGWAVRLFDEKGYDNVTVEQIAKAAGVSHMTFFRHFPTKVSVLLDDPYDPLIGQAIAAVDPTLPAIERVCRGILQAWGSVEQPDDALTRTRLRIVARREDLLAQAWSNNRRTEQIIVEALTSTGVPRLEARVAAGAVMGAMMAALVDWGESADSGELGDRIRTVLELLAGDVDAGGADV